MGNRPILLKCTHVFRNFPWILHQWSVHDHVNQIQCLSWDCLFFLGQLCQDIILVNLSRSKMDNHKQISGIVHFCKNNKDFWCLLSILINKSYRWNNKESDNATLLNNICSADDILVLFNYWYVHVRWTYHEWRIREHTFRLQSPQFQRFPILNDNTFSVDGGQ